MRSVLTSGFFWQFAGGFALGAAALVSFHPVHTGHGALGDVTAAAHAER